MKLVAAALALVGFAAAAAPPLPQESPPAPAMAPAATTAPATVPAPPTEHGLRQALQQFLRQQADPPPRHLSAEERAELRRQLGQYGRLPDRHP